MSRLKLPTAGTMDLFNNQEILESLCLEIDQKLDKKLSDTKVHLNKLHKASRAFLSLGDYNHWLNITYKKLDALIGDLKYINRKMDYDHIN